MTREEAIDEIREMLRVEKTGGLTLSRRTIAAFECALADIENAKELEGFNAKLLCPKCGSPDVWRIQGFEAGLPVLECNQCHWAFVIETRYRVNKLEVEP